MQDAFEDHCWRDLVNKEILEIYRAYHRDTSIGQKPALLAIDLYNLVFAGGPHPVHEVVKEFPSSCGVYAWEAIRPIQDLLTLVRSAGIPIVYTTVERRPAMHPESVRSTHRRVRITDEHAYDIREEFKPDPGDLIIFKERPSAFFGTPLIAHLRHLDVDSLLVCGQSTSGCVRATVVDGYSYGFHTVVVEECCFDRSLLSHKVNLFDLHHKYADVMHLENVERHLTRAQQVAPVTTEG